MEPSRLVNSVPSTPNIIDDKTASYTAENGDLYKSGSIMMRQDEHKGLDDSDLPDYHDKEVKRILRKVDWRLPSWLAVTYLLSFLDRSNIGNAKIAGMTKTLKMTGHDFNLALMVFFFTYATFMIPSNMILKKVRPSAWIAFLMTCWGTAMMCHGWVQTKNQLIVCRILLGLFEAGFSPAASFLCTLWYCRFEYQFRLALFYCSATLAGAFSGLLAYGIEKMDGVAGYEGWRWIFILEGLLTIVIGILTYWALPNSPQSCKFLNDGEKEIIRRRLAQDAGTKEGQVVNTGEGFEWRYLTDTLTDYKLWLTCIIICGQSIPYYAFSFFAPTIIKTLGYKTWEAQLLTVPIFLLACALTLGVSIYADGCQTRWKFVVYPYAVTSIAFIALLAIPHPKYPGATYAFLYLIPAGLSCGANSLIAWVANNLAPSWRRAIGMAFVPSIANFGGMIGSNIYLEKQAPKYPLGFGFSLAILLSGIIAALTLKWVLERENAKRDRTPPEQVKQMYTEQQLLEMGDRSPLYRYVT